MPQQFRQSFRDSWYRVLGVVVPSVDVSSLDVVVASTVVVASVVVVICVVGSSVVVAIVVVLSSVVDVITIWKVHTKIVHLLSVPSLILM